MLTTDSIISLQTNNKTTILSYVVLLLIRQRFRLIIIPIQFAVMCCVIMQQRFVAFTEQQRSSYKLLIICWNIFGVTRTLACVWPACRWFPSAWCFPGRAAGFCCWSYGWRPRCPEYTRHTRGHWWCTKTTSYTHTHTLCLSVCLSLSLSLSTLLIESFTHAFLMFQTLS